MSQINIRPAQVGDTKTILQFIHDLAIYEKEPDAVEATSEDIDKALFCESPNTFCLIAEADGTAIGIALYFLNFSTWKGRNGIYLEDLFVAPAARGLGAGKALLKELAKIAVANNYGRVEWSVLDWNTPSIDFYKALGAVAMDEWTVYRLSDQALHDFAASE